MADMIYRKELRDALYEADAVTMQGVKIINQFPAVNAVPVVRCRECIYYEKGKSYEPYCNHPTHGIPYSNDDDFCSYGERRENE